MPVSSWSTTAGSNGNTLGIDIGENCAAANVNNAMREMMAQLKTKLDSVDTSITAKQTSDATLTALAAVVTAADKLIYATGSDTFSTTTITSTARSLLDDASVAAMQATLGFSGTLATKGHAIIPLGSAGSLLINWGTESAVGANSSATEALSQNFSAVYAAFATYAENDAGIDQPCMATSTTTTVTVTNAAAAASHDIAWVVIGKA